MPAASSSSTDPIPVPKPKVAPKAAGKSSGIPRYTKYYVKDAGGRVIGHILNNENSESFDAHCLLHDGRCSVSRTYKPWDGALNTAMQRARGRCLAYLVAWLRWGAHFPARCMKERHVQAKYARGDDAALADGTGLERLEARAYVETEDDFSDLRRLERQPRLHEPIEPPGKF